MKTIRKIIQDLSCQTYYTTLGKYTIWRTKRLYELKHQMHGYCPSLRLERIAFLPFGFAIEWCPTAYLRRPHRLSFAACWIYEVFTHFGLDIRFGKK